MHTVVPALVLAAACIACASARLHVVANASGTPAASAVARAYHPLEPTPARPTSTSPSTEAPRVCVVTSHCDGNGDLGCASKSVHGGNSSNVSTLRACIASVNAYASLAHASRAQRIEFAVTTVNLTSALPHITAPHMTVDGTAAGCRQRAPDIRQQADLVHIDGARVPRANDADGLVSASHTRNVAMIYGSMPCARCSATIQCAYHHSPRSEVLRLATAL